MKPGLNRATTNLRNAATLLVAAYGTVGNLTNALDSRRHKAIENATDATERAENHLLQCAVAAIQQTETEQERRDVAKCAVPARCEWLEGLWADDSMVRIRFHRPFTQYPYWLKETDLKPTVVRERSLELTKGEIFDIPDIDQKYPL